ncbi:hypothetical protein [Georgenia yuyongxinii]
MPAAEEVDEAAALEGVGAAVRDDVERLVLGAGEPCSSSISRVV